jgi:hypothetical protein
MMDADTISRAKAGFAGTWCITCVQPPKLNMEIESHEYILVLFLMMGVVAAVRAFGAFALGAAKAKHGDRIS